ncbi:MAG: DUF4065 domain-containing protein [Gammaproteobacteria bacterium]|nr:DUF4065 domain-containing protein [Gammaproteobacteria bacterium]
MAFHDGREAFPEDFEAWVHGPVVPEIYNVFKDYRWNPISEEIAAPDLSSDLKKLIDEVLEVYGSESAFSLEQRTHREPPWFQAREGLEPDDASNNIIRKAWMKEFFDGLANQ